MASNKNKCGMSTAVLKKRKGINQINYRTSLLVGGKNRKTKNGIKEQFTILSSSQNRTNFLKVLVPNKDPVEDLYKLFPQLPEGERPINGFSCALHKDILLQGKMIVCSSCICFHSNIFGYETRVIIFFKNVLAIKREKTAFVVPNAISIRTLHKRYLFCSFISRESSFKLLSRTWKYAMDPKHDENIEYSSLKRTDKHSPSEDSPTDFNHNSILNESTSLSCSNSFYRNVSLPDRPHTSPPTLIGSSVDLEISSPYKTFPKYENLFDDCENNDESSSSSDLYMSRTPSDMFPFDNKLRKCRSSSNIDDIPPMSYKVYLKNLRLIKKEMDLNQDELDIASESHSQGVICSLSNKLRSYGGNIFSRCYCLLSTIYSFRCEQPAVLFLSFLIVMLALSTLNLFLRLNSIDNSLNPSRGEDLQRGEMKLNNLFSYKNFIHSKKVERIKSMLSVNLDTVNEVQKALKTLRERLDDG